MFGFKTQWQSLYCLCQRHQTDTLMPIIASKIKPDSVAYTDSYRSYNALDISDFKHFRINHSTEFIDKQNRLNHINGIENFWSQAKRVLRKYNGIDKKNFHLLSKNVSLDLTMAHHLISLKY